MYPLSLPQWTAVAVEAADFLVTHRFQLQRELAGGTLLLGCPQVLEKAGDCVYGDGVGFVVGFQLGSEVCRTEDLAESSRRNPRSHEES